MKPFTTAKLLWFDDGCCDVKFLDMWHNVPVNYRRGQPVDSSWHRDHYEHLLGYDARGALFQAASHHLMHYQFYPPDVMASVSHFGVYERPIQVGDRIVQRLHILQLFGMPILDAIGMTEIVQVIDEPRRCGFTYVTTDSHVEQGEWTAVLTWNAQDKVALTIDAVSRPIPNEPKWNHSLIRSRQRHAHQRGLAYFSQQVTKAYA